MLFLDRVVFLKRTVKREIPTTSTWTNEDAEKRIEGEYQRDGFKRVVVESPLDVPQPTQAEWNFVKDNRRSEIEVITKAYSSLL